LSLVHAHQHTETHTHTHTHTHTALTHTHRTHARTHARTHSVRFQRTNDTDLDTDPAIPAPPIGSCLAPGVWWDPRFNLLNLLNIYILNLLNIYIFAQPTQPTKYIYIGGTRDCRCCGKNGSVANTALISGVIPVTLLSPWRWSATH